jgi:hypothetical protein
LAASANINININTTQLKATLDDLKKLSSFIKSVNTQSTKWATSMQGMPQTWKDINKALTSVTNSMNRFSTISQNMATAAASMAVNWKSINQSTSKTNTTMNNMNTKTAGMATTSAAVASNWRTISQNTTKVQNSMNTASSASSNFQGRMKQAQSHTGGVLRNITGIFGTLRSMATGGGGIGSIGHLAGQMGMMFGPVGVAIGTSIGAVVTAVGFSISEAVKFRLDQAASLAVGVNNPFDIKNFANYMTMFTGGEGGANALLGSMANKATELGGPEFQLNFQRRMGVGATGKENPMDAAENQLRAMRKMAMTVPRELWKATAKALGVEDVVDMSTLTRFRFAHGGKGTTSAEFEDEVKKARADAAEGKLPETEAQILKDAAEKWQSLSILFQKMITDFSAQILNWGGKEAIDELKEVVKSMDKWINNDMPALMNQLKEFLKHPASSIWDALPFRNPTVPYTKEEQDAIDKEMAKQDAIKKARLDSWLKTIIWGIFGPPAHAGELPPGAKPDAPDAAPTADDSKGRDVFVKRIGPYNTLAAGKIPDNIQDIRDILKEWQLKTADDGGAPWGGAGMGGERGPRARGSGKSYGDNTKAGGGRGGGSLTFAESTNMSPEDRAMLDTMAYGESGAASYLSGDPDKGAAFKGNRYQFLGETWRSEIALMGKEGGDVNDTSPAHQDRVALHLIKRLAGRRYQDLIQNPEAISNALGGTWHALWKLNSGDVFRRALEGERKRLQEKQEKKDDTSPTPAPSTVGPSAKAPRGHLRIHDPNPDAKTSHEYPAPGEKSGFLEHSRGGRAPSQFVHVHVNNTTGSEVAVNAWMAVPQPAYV